MCNRLEIVRGELAIAERKLETVKEEAAATQHALQESLLQEQRRREVAEEDCRAQSEVCKNLYMYSSQTVLNHLLILIYKPFFYLIHVLCSFSCNSKMFFVIGIAFN